MGAISDPSSVPVLNEFLADPERSVRETCEIAVAKIEWDNSEEGKKHHASLNECTVPYVAVYPRHAP
jgi:deoxyhypusine monooxygenase